MNKKNEKFARLVCEHCEYIFVAPYPEDSTCPRCKKFSINCKLLLTYANTIPKDFKAKANKEINSFFMPNKTKKMRLNSHAQFRSSKFSKVKCEHCGCIFVVPYPKDCFCPKCHKFSANCVDLIRELKREMSNLFLKSLFGKPEDFNIKKVKKKKKWRVTILLSEFYC